MLRDVIAREVPALVRADSELYAVPAVVGALVAGIASTFDADSTALGAGVAAAVCGGRTATSLTQREERTT